MLGLLELQNVRGLLRLGLHQRRALDGVIPRCWDLSSSFRILLSNVRRAFWCCDDDDDDDDDDNDDDEPDGIP